MSDDIKVGIGVDASGMKSGMSQIKRELDDLKKKTKDGFFDLEGEKRVERNLGSMVSGLANAKGAAEGFTVALDKLENVFNSSIAASVTVVAFSEIIKIIQDAKAEWEAYAATAVKAQNDVYAAMSKGTPEVAFEMASKRIKELAKEIENFDSWRGKIGRGIAAMFDASMGSDEQRFFKMIQERRRLLELQGDASVEIAEAANQKIEEDNTERLKAWEKSQEEAIKKIRDARIKSEEEAAEKLDQQAEQQAEQQFRHYQDWLSKKDKADEDMAKRQQDRMEEAAKIMREHLDEMEKVRKEYADAEAQREKLTADRNKEYREKIIAEEMKTPSQRNDERQQARAEANAEDRAIRRLAQKAQDKQNASWRNPRMTNEQRDALAAQLKNQRAEDKKPQMEKDISEINQAIKKMEAKIGVQ